MFVFCMGEFIFGYRNNLQTFPPFKIDGGLPTLIHKGRFLAASTNPNT